MKKILLALGYIAGVVVGAKFAHKSVSSTKKKATAQSSDIKEQALDAGKEFIETHKNAFDEIKKEYWTAENKKLLLSKKADLMKFVDLIKVEINEAVAELKENGVDTDEIHEKIESIYAEKSTILKKLGKTPTAVAAKKKLSTIIQSTKKALKK
jgi:uncharacterized membrane-anchored protein YhcB (DUF1043 family)